MMTGDDFAKEQRARAQAPVELPLRLHRGEILLRLLEARTAEQKRAARIELTRIDEQMRRAGVRP